MKSATTQPDHEEEGGRRRRPRHTRDHLALLATGQPYDELGKNYSTTRLDPEQETRRLVAKLEALGHAVTLGTSHHLTTLPKNRLR